MVTLNVSLLPHPHAELAAHFVRAGGAAVSPHLKAADRDTWRSEVKRLCKEAGVPVRTGLTKNGLAVWAVHRDGDIALSVRLGVRADRALQEYGGTMETGNFYEPDSPEAQQRLNDLLSETYAVPKS